MFKDYYSILGVSYPSSNEEIHLAYHAKIEKLRVESAKESSPNYKERVDVEEAFRVLGASYILRTAYDKEYQIALTEGKDTYEIKDDWLLSGIERERDFVVNKMLAPNYKPPKPFVAPKKGWGMKALGCIGKVLLVYIILMTIIYVSKCSRNRSRESYNTASTINYGESAESQLRRIVIDKNTNLPQEMDENIITQEVLLESDALVYVYKVDDTFFSEFKEHAFSRDIQLSNLKTVYKEMKPMIDLLKETHRGIYYRYICRESGETAEFKIYYSDLVNLE